MNKKTRLYEYIDIREANLCDRTRKRLSAESAKMLKGRRKKK